MPVERDDWTDGPPDTPSPVPAKSQSISRPDWTAPADDVPDPVEGRPDWPPVPDEPETPHLEAAEQTAPPAEQTADSVLETMIAELATSGEHDLNVTHETVTAIQNAVPIADRAGFISGFDGLPPGAQKAIIGELALPRNEWETLADEDEVENFASTPEGAELVALWDDDADVNLGRVQARLSRIEANTSPAAIEVLWDWFDELPSSQAKAVFQVLAR